MGAEIRILLKARRNLATLIYYQLRLRPISGISNFTFNPAMTSPEPKSNHSSAPAFEFITLTQRPASHKNDFSYTVRSHAMQFFLRQKKISKTSKEVQPVTMHPGAESKTPRELSGKFKLATWSRKSRRKVVKDRAIDTLVEIRDEFSSVKYSPEQKPVQHVSRLWFGHSKKRSLVLRPKLLHPSKPTATHYPLPPKTPAHSNCSIIASHHSV